MKKNIIFKKKLIYLFIINILVNKNQSKKDTNIKRAIKLISNKKIRSFLDVIAICEGTKKNKKNSYSLPTLSEYQITFLNTQKITDLTKYPNKIFCTPLRGRKVCGSASGRYQFIEKTWNGLAKKYKQDKIFSQYDSQISNFFNMIEQYYHESIINLYQKCDDIAKYQFGPFWQDFYAILLLIEADAINDILTNNYEKILQKTSNIWSTIPVTSHNDSRYPSYINKAQKYNTVISLFKKYLTKKDGI
jgi:muramidase (phage lysozyme)